MNAETWSGEDAIAVVLLAAGLSRRMRDQNKLLLPIGGVPMVRKTASEILGADLGPVVAVTGYEQREVSAALADLDLTIMYNPDYEAGQMASVRAGCRALADRPGLSGIMIALGDMPALASSDYRALRDAFTGAEAKKITIPLVRAERGNPIVIPWRFVPDIVSGDLNAGCRKLIADRPDDIQTVTFESSSFLDDIDNPDDFRATLSF